MTRSIGRHPKYAENALRGGLIWAAIFSIFVGGCVLHYERGTYYYSNDFQHVSGSDDAYITYRYGWNLAQNHILSWNESGFRRTEGFTNPLWVLLSAIWALPGNKDLIYPGMVASCILISIGLLYLESLQVSKNVSSTTALFGIFILCASPVIWLHATSGLEALAFGAGIGLLAYCAITNENPSRVEGRLLNILAFFLALLRSDGFVYLVVLWAALILSRNRNWRTLVYGTVIGVVALLLWRAVSFGQLLPNTAIAKMNFGIAVRAPTGFVLLVRSLLSGTLILLMMGLFGLLASPKSVRIAAVITLAGWMAYYVYIGGDLFLERHLIGVMVLATGFSGSFFSRILQEKRGWLLALALLVGIFSPLYMGDPRFDYLRGKPQDAWILMGKEIAAHRSQYGTIVTFPAGKIPFYAGGDFIDELGLNDPELAKVQQPRFVPGHSAGSFDLAIERARQHSPVFSYFAFGMDLTAENAPDVLLWVDNVHPGPGVQYGLNALQQDQITRAAPFTYSLLIRGQ